MACLLGDNREVPSADPLQCQSGQEDGVSAGDPAGDGSLNRVYSCPYQSVDPLCSRHNCPWTASLYDCFPASNRDDPADPVYRRACMDAFQHGGFCA